jgi:hypothetical protein
MTELPLVHARDLPSEYRRALRPGETMTDRAGRAHVLPSSFLRIDSWDIALQTQLTPHFQLWELIGVDVRETPPGRLFPRFVPCALLQLAAALELLRLEVGTFVHIAANGGYRSPAHALSSHASRHCWGTAANIYQIGSALLDSRQDIEKYAAVARTVIPGVWTRPYGEKVAEADDHLHIDIGYVLIEPTREEAAT